MQTKKDVRETGLKHRITRKIGSFWRSRKTKKWKQRLTNKDFSIVCSTCIGGHIYHDLGMKFLSPTINMFIKNPDFIKFACNLKYYMSQELRFIETDKGFPVAMLGDIELNFNHASTNEEAADNWNRRKARINYDNLYFIFYYREGMTIEQIREIEKAQCKRAAIITYKPLDLPYAVYLKGNGTSTQSFLEKDMFGIMPIEKEWDFVSWLNGEDNRESR